MTFVSIAGVCVGVAMLIIVLSVMGGFEQDLRRKMLNGQPHLKIHSPASGEGISLQEFPIEKIKKIIPESTAIEPFTEADVVLKRKRHVMIVTVFGLDLNEKSSERVWPFESSMISGELASIKKLHAPIFSEDEPEVQSKKKYQERYPGIILGMDLASDLGVELGEEVTMLTPSTNMDLLLGSGGRLARFFVVSGMFATNAFNYDRKWAVIDIEQGRKLLPEYHPSLKNKKLVSGIAINIKDPFQVQEVASRIKNELKLEALTWEMANKSLLFALKLEKFCMGAILMLIVVVAAFSISGTLMMTVFHRRNQISLLRAIGMNQKNIARLYLIHGLIIGLLGVLSGTILGISVCIILGYIEIFSLQEGVFYLKYLPVKFLPWDYLVIAGAALLMSLIAGMYPAIVASKQPPGVGLRV